MGEEGLEGRAQGQELLTRPRPGEGPARGQHMETAARQAGRFELRLSSRAPRLRDSRPALGHSEPGPFILSLSSASAFLGLAVGLGPPSHPSLAGKLCQERKEVGGRAGGIQDALLG